MCLKRKVFMYVCIHVLSSNTIMCTRYKKLLYDVARIENGSRVVLNYNSSANNTSTTESKIEEKNDTVGIRNYM